MLGFNDRQNVNAQCAKIIIEWDYCVAIHLVQFAIQTLYVKVFVLIQLVNARLVGI